MKNKGALVVSVSVLLMLIAAAASARGRREAVDAKDGNRGMNAADPNPGVSHDQATAGPNKPNARVEAQEAAPPPPTEKINPADASKLLSEFYRAQSSELKALDHRHKLELKELKASQAARESEWEKREKEARRKFFKEHSRGRDKRAYMGELMERRKAFKQSLVEERTRRARDQDVRASSMRADHGERLKEFKSSVAKGEKPAARLWPGAS